MSRHIRNRVPTSQRKCPDTLRLSPRIRRKDTAKGTSAMPFSYRTSSFRTPFTGAKGKHNTRKTNEKTHKHPDGSTQRTETKNIKNRKAFARAHFPAFFPPRLSRCPENSILARPSQHFVRTPTPRFGQTGRKNLT